jgi:hypothetical protein
MGYIAQGDLIANMTPEQKILVQQFYAKFDIGGGVANRKILNVEPLFYDGLIAGSEFLSYAATKMYLCFQMKFSVLQANILGGVIGSIVMYDETDSIDFTLSNASGFFNATERIFINPICTINDDFSRIVSSNYTYMKFIGYRVTLGTV